MSEPRPFPLPRQLNDDAPRYFADVEEPTEPVHPDEPAPPTPDDAAAS